MREADNWGSSISAHDLIRSKAPSCWQDGVFLGNGSIGSVFYAPQALEWLVNKNDVIDARVPGVKQVIPREKADRMIAAGATAGDFEKAERGTPAPEGTGPKTCCSLLMDLGTGVSGTRSATPDINARLSLYDATLYLNLDKHLCHPRVESFVRADEDILVIRVTDVSPIVANCTRIFFSRPEDVELGAPELWFEGSRIFMRMNMPEGVRYVAGLEAIPRESSALRQDVLRRIREKYHPPSKGAAAVSVRGRFGIMAVGGDFDLFLTVATSRDGDDPEAIVRRRLDMAVKTSYQEIRMSHCSWWEDFWQRSKVEIGGGELEHLFYHSLYTLGSTYRRTPLPGLLGLFYGPDVGPVQISPWCGSLTQDLNVQCAFLPVHVLNHSELFDAYLDSYDEYLPEARRLAREVWGAGGAQFGIALNSLGRPLDGGVGHYRYFFGGSYVALMHCLSWKYCRDIERLRNRIFPFLKEILEFYMCIMAKEADGQYHLHPAHACELDIMDVGDPVQTISMLKICLHTAIEAAHELVEKDQNLVGKWKDLLENLPEYPRAVDGEGREVLLDGVGVPADHHVGQAGCLHPVYPCGEVDEFSGSELIGLYNRTLDSVVEKTAQISYADERGFFYQCVWQCFFRAMTALRLGRADEFHRHYLPMFLRAYVKPNRLVSHDAVIVAPSAKTEANLADIPDESLDDVGDKMPKFEPWCGHAGGSSPNPAAKEFATPLIEGSADYLTMITECLLQSHNGIIRVFPAWPGDASFSGLISEGRVSVSASKKNGKVVEIKLRKLPGGASRIKLKSPWTGKIEEHLLSEGKEYTINGSKDIT